MEKVEEAEEMLASLISFQDPNSSTIKDESLNDFDRQAGNSLLMFGEEEFKTDVKIANSQQNMRIVRPLHKKLTYHSPLLPKIYEETHPKEKESEEKPLNLQKNFQSKHLLRIDTQTNINPSSERITSARTFSPGTEKFIDLFELSMVFENMRNYKFYFPHNNAELVIRKFFYGRNNGLSGKKNRRKKYWKKSRIISAKISQITSLINSMEEIKKSE